jgi:hypothetical protein
MGDPRWSFDSSFGTSVDEEKYCATRSNKLIVLFGRDCDKLT